jgi:hypothetical protein
MAGLTGVKTFVFDMVGDCILTTIVSSNNKAILIVPVYEVTPRMMMSQYD